ncbi:MAG: hypothetical protein WD771_05740 [Gemmatimonadaceae bacterium]
MTRLRATLTVAATALLATAACEDPAPPWDSEVTAELEATSYVVGDTATVQFVNASSEPRYFVPCWAAGRLESGVWEFFQPGSSACSSVPGVEIAPGGTLAREFKIWLDDAGDRATGTFRYTFYIRAGPGYESETEAVATEAFVVN